MFSELYSSLQKIWLKFDRQLYYNLLSEQFSTHFGVCCVVTRSILNPIETITKEYRHELTEMLIINQRLHVSGSVK